MTYVMESDREGQRIEAKTDKQLLIEQLFWVGIEGKTKILDLGCAAGTTPRIIKEMLGETCQVIGIDASETRINEARAISDNVEYRVGKAESLPAQNEEFDVSWSRFTFEYLKNPLHALREMKRVTKQGGTVAVADIDGNCSWHYPITIGYEKELTEAISFLGESGFDPFIGRKLYSLFKQIGLKNVEVDIRPYHKIVGKIDAKSEILWKFKLNTIAKNLVKMGWSEKKSQKIIEDYLDILRDENTFTYSTLITVKGKVGI
jgi:ubiquinone/menaquinone biosynthesis C-methylase UbiE